MSGKGTQDSAEKKRCVRVLQNLMALPNVSLSVFLTQQFREDAAALNPRFALPTSRGGLCSLLDGPLQVIKENIAREVGGSAGALVTVDIWSGRCFKDSFIAATIHYVGGGSLKNAFLGLKRLKGRHDAKTVKRGYLKILNSVSISESSIYRVVTDSGANIVCAFKNEYEVLHDETGNAGCGEVTAVKTSNDEDDNASTCSDRDLFGSSEDEIDDFEEAARKIGLDMRFPKRLSFMAHTLQLALAGGLKASGCRAEVDALIRVVGKFRKTRLAAERLHARSRLNLIMPCSIHWNCGCCRALLRT